VIHAVGVARTNSVRAAPVQPTFAVAQSQIPAARLDSLQIAAGRTVAIPAQARKVSYPSTGPPLGVSQQGQLAYDKSSALSAVRNN